MESTDDIKSVVIKEECDDDFEFPDYVSTSITPLATENHLQGVKDYDASIKIEEQGVQVFKEEVTEETTTKEVETVYLLEQPFKKSLLCLQCSTAYVDYCTRCPMLLRVLDSVIREGTPDRAKLTIPRKILKYDSTSGVVYAKQNIPPGVTFGPHEGLYKNGDWFEVKEGKLVCFANPEYSNWLRYVSYTFTFALANIVTVQCGDDLYFRSCKEILAGEALLLYLTGDFRKTLFKPVLIELLGDSFACTLCCLGFSQKRHLARHWKVCPYPRSEQEKNFQNIVPYDSEPVRKARRRMLKKQSTQLEEEEEEESLEESPTQQPNRLQEQPSKKQPKDLRKQSLSGQRSKIINLDRVCDICQRKFASDRLLKCHKELAHKPVQCDKCRRYLPAEKFAAHMEMHRINKKKKLYKCNYCDYMSEKKCVDFVLHMIHKYDKKESVETNGSAEDSAITPVE